jgi:anti-anti-sigma regulatory factor
MGEAKRINDNSSNKTAVPDTALYAFSQGAHTIMDGSPPAHREFQVYDLAPFKAMFLINPVTAALAYKEAIDAHGAEEAREPTQDEMNRMVDDMRMQYLNRFGREMYEQAVSPAEREAGVVSKGARVAIIDITGVPTVDTHVASVLIRASQAVRILDAEVVLTGIRSRVARTLVELGVDLGGLVTRGSLQASITYAQSRL